MIATSARRVAENTPEHLNTEIRRKTEMNIAYYAAHPERIDQRLRELDEEWDIERMIQIHAATLSLVGVTFGVLRGRKWFALPGIVAGFLMQHALRGWCPPVSVLRRLGVRTRHEIDTEYFALKALRGDFRNLSEDPRSLADASAAFEAARR